jgi:hypothetical protein
VVPGANPCAPNQGGTVNNVTGSGSANVTEPVPGTYNVDVPAIPPQIIVTGTDAAVVTQPVAGTYNVNVPNRGVNEMYGDITIQSADGSIVVENDYVNNVINLRPFFNVISGSFASPTFSWNPATSDLTMTATSTTTYTGTWMFFYQATLGQTGWATSGTCFLRWSAGPVGSENVRQTDVGAVNGNPVYHSNSFIDEFGTTPRAVRLGCVLNNITFTSNPSFGGIFYSCKLSD